jgi:hypothetical protein
MSATPAPMIVDNERPPIGDWEQTTARAQRLAATVDSYLDELAATRSPATVQAVAATLRQFAAARAVAQLPLAADSRSRYGLVPASCVLVRVFHREWTHRSTSDEVLGGPVSTTVRNASPLRAGPSKRPTRCGKRPALRCGDRGSS